MPGLQIIASIDEKHFSVNLKILIFENPFILLFFSFLNNLLSKNISLDIFFFVNRLMKSKKISSSCSVPPEVIRILS